MVEGWTFEEFQTDGRGTYSGPLNQVEGGKIAEGLEKLKAQPEKWAGLSYQSDMTSWPEDQQKYVLYNRESEYTPTRVPGSWMTYVQGNFTKLPPATFTDNVSNSPGMSTYGGQKLDWKRPGRGEGIADMPSLKLFGDVDPDDIRQGQVGDCWMVSAISALAEFDGEVLSLFSSDELSKDGKYTITLYDLPSKQFKEVEIDDRLACVNGRLLSLKPTADNEIWPLLLEKAFCAHAGGWDKINGGQATMAFVAFTGCTETFTIKNENEGNGQPGSYIKLLPDWDKYEENNCHCPQSRQGMPLSNFPGEKLKIGEDELFDLLCDWDNQNYVVCAGTGQGSDTNTTDGIVDGHAYSLISAKKQVCGKVDLLLFRNPHGKTEFKGGWNDGGDEWRRNPDVKAELNHTEDPDDGLFWMEKKDAFRYFHNFYVCCKSMDHGKIPKFANKSDDVKSRRRQDNGTPASLESIPAKRQDTPSGPSVPPVPAANDSGWGGVPPVAPAAPEGPPKYASNAAALPPQPQADEQPGCMDVCKGCTVM